MGGPACSQGSNHGYGAHAAAPPASPTPSLRSTLTTTTRHHAQYHGASDWARARDRAVHSGVQELCRLWGVPQQEEKEETGAGARRQRGGGIVDRLTAALSNHSFLDPDPTKVALRVQGVGEKLAVHGRALERARLLSLASLLLSSSPTQDARPITKPSSTSSNPNATMVSAVALLLQLSHQPLARPALTVRELERRLEGLQLARIKQEEEARRFRRELLAPDDASQLDRDVRQAAYQWQKAWKQEDDDETKEAEPATDIVDGEGSAPTTAAAPTTTQEGEGQAPSSSSSFFLTTNHAAAAAAASGSVGYGSLGPAAAPPTALDTSSLREPQPHQPPPDPTHPCMLAMRYAAHLESKGVLAGVTPRFHYISETEVLRAVLHALNGSPSPLFLPNRDDPSSFFLAPAAAHGRLLTPHCTPTSLRALLRKCLRTVNLAAYIRGFLRRVWQEGGRRLGPLAFGPHRPPGRVLEAFAEAAQAWVDGPWAGSIAREEAALYRAQRGVEEEGGEGGGEGDSPDSSGVAVYGMGLSPGECTLLQALGRLRDRIHECELLAVCLRECVAQEIVLSAAHEEEDGEGEGDLRRWTGRFLSWLQAMAAAEERVCVASSIPPTTTPTPPPSPLLLTRLFHAALAPYAMMVEGWVERGDPGDIRGEFCVQGLGREAVLRADDALPTFLRPYGRLLAGMGEAGATIAALSSSSSSTTTTTTTTTIQQQQQRPSHTSLLLASSPSSFDVEHPFPSLPDRCLQIRAQAVAALLLLNHRHGGTDPGALAPLSSALRMCERLYLRGGTRGGLLSGLVEEAFSALRRGVRPTPRMVTAWALRSLSDHGMPLLPSSSSAAASPAALTVGWSFASHAYDDMDASMVMGSINRLCVIDPLTPEGCHATLAALTPGWQDQEQGDYEEEGGGRSPVAVFPGGSGDGDEDGCSVTSALPLSVVWRPPPALLPFVTPEAIRAYNELFLLPLPARYVRARAEALLLQGKEEEQGQGRRRRGRGDEGSGQQEQLRRRGRRARAMALHYVTAALDEFFSSASAAAAASSTPADPSNEMEDEGWVGLVAHMRAAARDPRAVAAMHASYLARRRRRALLAGGRRVRALRLQLHRVLRLALQLTERLLHSPSSLTEDVDVDAGYWEFEAEVGVAVSCLRALLHPSSHTTVNTNTRRRQQQQAEGPGSIVMGMGVYGMGVEDEGGAALLATLLHRLDFWGAQKNMTTRV